MSEVNLEKYRKIYFSYLYRDSEFPAIIKSKGFTYKGFISVLLSTIIKDIKDFIKGLNHKLDGTTWIYVDSVNQYRSLEFLAGLPGTIFVSSSKTLISLLPMAGVIYMSNPYNIQQRFSLTQWKRYKEIFGDSFWAHINSIIKFDGITESLPSLIKVHRPVAIIMSNDHNLMNRALILAAKDYDISTIYLQHAAVTDRFPPLLFDYNLLEGEDSLIKYKRAGTIAGVIELVGMPKYDEYHRYLNSRSQVKVVGIALNNGDDFPSYFRLLERIKVNFPEINVIMRFHPSINTDALNLKDNVVLSKSTEEASFVFLSKIDVLIAGDSSIHLEATLLNVVSIYLDFKTSNIIDYYGFLENGLVDRVGDDQFISWLHSIRHQKPDVRSRAKFYVDSVDTEWDGKSCEKVRNIIIKIQESKFAKG